MTRTADALQALFDYLGDDRWDLGEIITDVAEGAEMLDKRAGKLLKELFDSMPNNDSLDLHTIADNIRQVGTGFAHTVAADILTGARDEEKLGDAKVLCTRCAQNEVPAPKSAEEDPLCDSCIEILSCPGYNDSCSNLKEENTDLCSDCKATRNQIERLKNPHSIGHPENAAAFEARVKEIAGCPGYNLGPNEDCGGPKMKGSDLCGDCHMARCDAESPRIPR